MYIQRRPGLWALQKLLQETPNGVFEIDTQKLAPIGSQLNSIVGPIITAAATIAPTNHIHHVAATTAIATITPPYSDFQGDVIFIADTVFTWNTSGNIMLSGTATVNKAYRMTFDGSKWFPDVVV
jgi:hypothetical protein